MSVLAGKVAVVTYEALDGYALEHSNYNPVIGVYSNLITLS